jgi:hypothetical protein
MTNLMTLIASLPVETFDISRLWLTIMVLAAVLPPGIAWAIRRNWQFSLRQLLLAVSFVAAGLALSHKDLALIVTPQDPYKPRIPTISWKVGQSSPWESVVAAVVISSLFTLAVHSRTVTKENVAGDANSRPPQSPHSADHFR